MKEVERVHARAALVLVAADLDSALSAGADGARAADLRRAAREIEVASTWLHDQDSPELRTATSEAFHAARNCEANRADTTDLRVAISDLERRRIALMSMLDETSG